MLVQVTAGHMWHHEVDSLSSLEEVLHAAQVLVLSLEQDAQLGNSIHHLVFINKPILSETFHCVELTCLFQLSEIYTTKTTSSELSLEIEVL